MKFNSRQVLIGVAVVVVIAAAAIYWLVSRQNTVSLDATAVTSNATSSTTAAAQQAASDAPTTAATSDLMQAGPLGDMTLGDPKAPNVMIEYASMTCTHCQRFHAEVYPTLKSQYIDTGKVYFIFRDFPLDSLARAAIIIAHCAPKERFFPLVDLMFDHQDQWAFVDDPKTALLNLVKQAGFTEDSFNACLTNQQLLDGVNWVQDRAEKMFGVGSTPTFFVNGKKLTGEQT
ncbi:MAG TPA: DsbA family protein, partial [Bauldia sp.]|nr:DsbA family protein [Bauldia sp.]